MLVQISRFYGQQVQHIAIRLTLIRCDADRPAAPQSIYAPRRTPRGYWIRISRIRGGRRGHLEIEFCDKRRVIRWLAPSPCVFMDIVADRRAGKLWADPYMVEATTLVRCAPVAGAVAPPGVEAFGIGDEPAADIDPFMCTLQPGHRFDFKRCVAHDIDELLMAPDIGFQRGDIKIAQQDGRRVELVRPLGHPLVKVELLAKFRVEFTVRNFPACRNIDILDPHTVFQPRTNVTRLAIVLPVEPFILVKRHAADHGNAVVHGLSVEDEVIVTELTEYPLGELVIAHLGFLKAENVG